MSTPVLPLTDCGGPCASTVVPRDAAFDRTVCGRPDMPLAPLGTLARVEPALRPMARPGGWHTPAEAPDPDLKFTASVACRLRAPGVSRQPFRRW